MKSSIHSDYHTHTYYSDGTLSPQQVVQWAHSNGITSMAVTDHDGMGGLEQAAKEAKKLGIEFINGIELSTAFEDGTGLHVLGYGIDPDDSALCEVCSMMQQWREERNEKLLAALREEGYPISKDSIGASFVSKPAIARQMVVLGYINEVKEAFDNIFSSERMRNIPKQKISSYDAIDLIKGAGGTAVLAHPGLIRHQGKRGTREFYDNVEVIVSKMAAHGMGGLECCYSKHSDEEERCFSDMARRYDLMITRGSDYHGPEIRR